MRIQHSVNNIRKLLEQIRSSIYNILDKKDFNSDQEKKDFNLKQKENISVQFKELEKSLIEIEKIEKDVEWEKKTLKKFHFNNTMLMLFPTIISIGLIIFTIMVAPQKRKMISKLRTISQYQNSIIENQKIITAFKDSIINLNDSSKLRFFERVLTITKTKIDSLMVEKKGTRNINKSKIEILIFSPSIFVVFNKIKNLQSLPAGLSTLGRGYWSGKRNHTCNKNVPTFPNT